MKSRWTESEMALEAVKLANQVEEKNQIFVIAGLVVVSDKILDEEYKKKLLEVLEMTQIERMIREKGREEEEVSKRQQLEEVRDHIFDIQDLEDVRRYLH